MAPPKQLTGIVPTLIEMGPSITGSGVVATCLHVKSIAWSFPGSFSRKQRSCGRFSLDAFLSDERGQDRFDVAIKLAFGGLSSAAVGAWTTETIMFLGMLSW